VTRYQQNVGQKVNKFYRRWTALRKCSKPDTRNRGDQMFLPQHYTSVFLPQHYTSVSRRCK